MKIYKTKHFAKWAKKENLTDDKLVEAIEEVLEQFWHLKLVIKHFLFMAMRKTKLKISQNLN